MNPDLIETIRVSVAGNVKTAMAEMSGLSFAELEDFSAGLCTPDGNALFALQCYLNILPPEQYSSINSPDFIVNLPDSESKTFSAKQIREMQKRISHFRGSSLCQACCMTQGELDAWGMSTPPAYIGDNRLLTIGHRTGVIGQLR